MEGMTTEHGPLVLYGVKEDGVMFSGKLSKNPYAWNKQAHVLYVDQPRYVGFSCGTGDFVTSSVEAGRDMVAFLRGWRILFPEHAARSLVLATESYGGHYVPAWSSAILDYNAGASDPLRLTGVAIGNGIVNNTVQAFSFPEFARRQGLIPANATRCSDQEAHDLMRKHLGYQPNYYDYRLADKECCGCSSYNYKPWTEWLLRDDVTAALNVCGNAGDKAFGQCAAGCIDLPDFDKDDTFDYSGALGRALRNGVHVTLYYGMQDTACDYVGGFAMATSLHWPGSADFARAPSEDLMISGVPAGKIKAAAGLTWIQVEGAGHMVPINNPAAASFAVGTVTARGGRGAVPTASPGLFLGAAADCPPPRKHLMSAQAAPGGGAGGALHLVRRFYQHQSARADPLTPQEVLVALASGCLIVVGFAAIVRLDPFGGRPRSDRQERLRFFSE